MYKSSQFVFKLASVSFLYGFLRDEKRHCIIPLPRFRSCSQRVNCTQGNRNFQLWSLARIFSSMTGSLKSYCVHVTLILRIRRTDLVPQVSPTAGLGKEHTVNYGSLVYVASRAVSPVRWLLTLPLSHGALTAPAHNLRSTSESFALFSPVHGSIQSIVLWSSLASY